MAGTGFISSNLKRMTAKALSQTVREKMVVILMEATIQIGKNEFMRRIPWIGSRLL